MVYQDGRQKQQNINKGVSDQVGQWASCEPSDAPPSRKCVMRPRGRGVKGRGAGGQEVEVKGHTRSVRILCFPEVFLWSWFLLWL